jgi:hypothetical protein
VRWTELDAAGGRKKYQREEDGKKEGHLLAAAQRRIGQPIHFRCALLQVVSNRGETDKYLYLRIKPEAVSPFHQLTVLAEARFLARFKLHRIRGFKLPVAYPRKSRHSETAV